MYDAKEIEKLRTLSGESDENLLSLLLEDAESEVLAYTNRTHVIDVLKKPIRDLALIAYNRMGTEGESGRSEAGESYSFEEKPKQIYDVLNRYRLARVGGHAYEKKQGETVLSQESDSV